MTLQTVISYFRLCGEILLRKSTSYVWAWNNSWILQDWEEWILNLIELFERKFVEHILRWIIYFAEETCWRIDL
jgi:hypothetical protein